MRWILVSCVLVLLGVGVATFAQGQDDPEKELENLKSQVALLEMQVDFLLQREAALTDYVVGSLERGSMLEKGFQQARREGFTKAAISSTSREALLRTLEHDAKAIQKDVPARSKDQVQLLSEIERRLKSR